MKTNSEIGKQYGYLTVLEDTRKKYHSTKIYKCRCVCGKEIEVNINKLHTGHVRSCGCRRFRWKDLTGQKFGRLAVLGFAYTRDKKNYWRCRCDCGNNCYVSTSQLTTGETVSCGCKNDENRANLSNLDRGLVDGTMKCGIKADRKLNRNNTSGVRGFISIGSEDYGWRRLCSNVRPICWAGSNTKGPPSKQGRQERRSSSENTDKMGIV